MQGWINQYSKNTNFCSPMKFISLAGKKKKPHWVKLLGWGEHFQHSYKRVCRGICFIINSTAQFGSSSVCQCTKGIPQPQKRSQMEEDKYEHLNPAQKTDVLRWRASLKMHLQYMFIKAGTRLDKCMRLEILVCLMECRSCWQGERVGWISDGWK